MPGLLVRWCQSIKRPFLSAPLSFVLHTSENAHVKSFRHYDMRWLVQGNFMNPLQMSSERNSVWNYWKGTVVQRWGLLFQSIRLMLCMEIYGRVATNPGQSDIQFQGLQ